MPSAIERSFLIGKYGFVAGVLSQVDEVTDSITCKRVSPAFVAVAMCSSVRALGTASLTSM